MRSASSRRASAPNQAPSVSALKRGAAPERERRGGVRGRRVRVAVAPRRHGRGQQLPRTATASTAACVQRVPVAGAGNGLATERGAQPGDMVLDGISRSSGEVGAPQRVDQVVHRDDAAVRERQHCQQRLPFPTGYVDAPSARDDLERAQQPDLQPVAHTHSDGTWATSVPRPDAS